MPYPLERLLEQNPEPKWVLESAKVADALAIMIENDYSQLPVLDSQSHMMGFISYESIARTYFHLNGSVSLLDLDVGHCMTPALTVEADRDIIEALSLLRSAAAVVVVKDHRLYRVLTYYDTTEFFHGFSRSLMILEHIELTLRQYIEAMLPNDNIMQTALMRAFGADKRDPAKPARDYSDLTLAEHKQLIVTDENWRKFEPYFQPKEFFQQLLSQVGDIRNEQMHFRGELDTVQFNALTTARDWLNGRPKPKRPGDEQETVHVEVQDLQSVRIGGRYEALQDWLTKQKAKSNLIQAGFTDLDEVLGEPLPQSALENRSWWANDATSHVQSLAWLKAGWKVEGVDFAQRLVTFRQTLHAPMQLFFTEVLQQIREYRPGLTRATKASMQNWVDIGAGRSGFRFAWVFTSEDTLRIELYIDTGNGEQNKTAFERLRTKREQIEEAFGAEMKWDRLDAKRACRISVSRPAKITDPADKLEETKVWAVKAGLRFIDTIQPHVRELSLE